MRFQGKTAVITGGAKGFGQAFATALAEEGCRVILVDVDQDQLKASAQAIGRLRGGSASAEARVCDVTDKGQVTELMAHVLESYGAIDILINNAGGSMGVPKVPIEDVSEADWDRVVALNLKGTFLCTQAAARPMKEARQGKIVNLASLAARIGGQMTPVQYCTAKGGVVAFTRHVAQELGPFGINVNAVAPGLVLTGERIQNMWYGRNDAQEREKFINRIPLGRLAEVDEVTRIVVFLCSAEASYLAGVTLDVNGGMFSP